MWLTLVQIVAMRHSFSFYVRLLIEFTDRIRKFECIFFGSYIERSLGVEMSRNVGLSDKLVKVEWRLKCPLCGTKINKKQSNSQKALGIAWYAAHMWRVVVH